MPLAILQMSDTPQIESTALMLRNAGYEIKVCGKNLRDTLIKDAGCDTVLAVSQMIALGYDELEGTIPEASVPDMDKCDLFVEIKIRNVQKIWNRWPRLQGRTMYWRVNGAQPEICPKGGDEVNLICPVATACLWYGVERYYQTRTVKPIQAQSELEHLSNRSVTPEDFAKIFDTYQSRANGMAYTFWPPYPRSAPYDAIERAGLVDFTSPYCVAHSVRAWGYGEIIDECTKLGIKIYGNNSPDGQVKHQDVPKIASTAKALVHLKSVDCPGWALYEAILAGCPVITGRLLNSRMLAYDLLDHGKTCLEFGVPASLEYGRGPMEMEKCVADIKEALAILSDPGMNYQIGRAAKIRLNELMWNVERDGSSFNDWIRKWFM